MNELFLRFVKKLIAIVIGRDRFLRIQKRRYSKKASSNLRENGVEALSVFSRVAKSVNKSYWVYWGTLLGVYREKDFIKTDDDIDVGMFREDLTKEFINDLLRNDFVFLHAIYEKSGDGLHIALSYKDVKFDLYSFSQPNEKGCIVGFSPSDSIDDKRFSIVKTTHKFVGFSDIEFKGIQVKVPSNIEDVLRVLYGNNFMTPIPKFSKEYNGTPYSADYCLVPIEDDYAEICNYSEFSQIVEGISQK